MQTSRFNIRSNSARVMPSNSRPGTTSPDFVGVSLNSSFSLSNFRCTALTRLIRVDKSVNLKYAACFRCVRIHCNRSASTSQPITWASPSDGDTIGGLTDLAFAVFTANSLTLLLAEGEYTTGCNLIISRSSARPVNLGFSCDDYTGNGVTGQRCAQVIHATLKQDSHLFRSNFIAVNPKRRYCFIIRHIALLNALMGALHCSSALAGHAGIVFHK